MPCWLSFDSKDKLANYGQLQRLACWSKGAKRWFLYVPSIAHVGGRLDICWAYALLGDASYLPDAEVGWAVLGDCLFSLPHGPC